MMEGNQVIQGDEISPGRVLYPGCPPKSGTNVHFTEDFKNLDN
jgi:hypothetical protein